MFDIDSLYEIWQTITRNKLRSLLTAFGVFWGIFMLVVMASVGTGFRNGIMSGIELFEANSSFFFANSTSLPYKGFAKGRVWKLKTSDIEAIKKNFSETKYITGAVFGGISENNVMRGEKLESFRVMGMGSDINQINPMRILQGRFFNPIDDKDARKVCVIGEKVYNNLYDKGENAIGTTIRAMGVYYTVVGVVQSLSDKVNLFGPSEEMVILPLSTIQIAMNSGDAIDCVAMAVQNNVHINDVEKQVSQFLKQRAIIDPNDEMALMSFNTKKIFDSFDMLIMGLNALIWLVGLGTLLSGVVGVSNIMLVTVRERTQEIGVRRALGATPSVIIRQILSESVLLTILAGVLGLVAAILVMSAVDSVMNMSGASILVNPFISFGTAIAALVILIMFGLIAGYLPSKRALDIKAIDALRDE